MAMKDYPTCRCTEDYVCDIHDTSPTGREEMFEQMLADGFAEYDSVLDEIEYEQQMELI